MAPEVSAEPEAVAATPPKPKHLVTIIQSPRRGKKPQVFATSAAREEAAHVPIRLRELEAAQTALEAQQPPTMDAVLDRMGALGTLVGAIRDLRAKAGGKTERTPDGHERVAVEVEADDEKAAVRIVKFVLAAQKQTWRKHLGRSTPAGGTAPMWTGRYR